MTKVVTYILSAENTNTSIKVLRNRLKIRNSLPDMPKTIVINAENPQQFMIYQAALLQLLAPYAFQPSDVALPPGLPHRARRAPDR